MINVNQITAQLARMPDQALQQFAAMHKGDPYTVSLALSESNRRKQMRTAAQMPQGGEPPKVVDQEVAQMAQALPEDTGIGALPAGDMNFADGGIVGYADGGRPLAAMQGGASVPFGGYGGGPSMIPAQTGYEGMGIMEFLRTFGSELLAKLPSEEKERLKANDAKKAQSFEAERERNMAQLAGPSGSPTDPEFRRQPDPRMAGISAIPDVSPATGPSMAPSIAAKQPPAPTAGIERLAPPRAAAPASAQDFLSQQQALEKRLGPAVDEFAQRREDITAEDVKARREGIASLKADQEADLKEMFKGKEERLGKREAELGKEKGKVEGLALLEAGLAMMQSKGRGLAGIAAGAGVGVKAYAAGIDKIKSGQEKIDEARDRMEELRQAQASMNKRDVRAEEKDIRATLTEGRRDLLKGAEQAGVKRQALTMAAAASDIAGQRAREQQASAERIAAQNRAALAGRAEGAGEKLDLERLKAQAKILQDRIKEIPNYGAGKAQRAALERELQDIQKQMGGGTMPPPSAAPALGGLKFLGFE